MPPTVEEEQEPPVAVDDAFGVRPGRATVLPVLLNDYDPNADVLVVAQVEPIDEDLGRVDLVTRNQQLQLTLAPDATGSVSFRYTITDGRGGTATASVTMRATASGTHSSTIANTPASASAMASSTMARAPSSVLPCTLKPPKAFTDCGVRPRWR